MAKGLGLESFCKSIAIDTDIAAKISEAEFVEVVGTQTVRGGRATPPTPASLTKIAKEQDTTFVKLFSAQDDLSIASLRLRTALIDAVDPDVRWSFIASSRAAQKRACCSLLS